MSAFPAMICTARNTSASACIRAVGRPSCRHRPRRWSKVKVLNKHNGFLIAKAKNMWKWRCSIILIFLLFMHTD